MEEIMTTVKYFKNSLFRSWIWYECYKTFKNNKTALKWLKNHQNKRFIFISEVIYN